MGTFEEDILKRVKEDHNYIVNLRRHFHKYPEIAKEEKNTCLKIEEELDNIGISHKRVGEYGVAAYIKGNKIGNKKIVLRADIDALPINEENDVEYKSIIPNRMHACGHDSHTASLIGAARVLNSLKDSFAGEILLSFQQGEEIGYGARIVVDSGIIDGYDRSFGLHSASYIETGKIAFTSGPINAAVDFFRIKVNGKAAHVSTPELGVDALYIASLIVTSIQGITTRRNSPQEPLLIGIGKLISGDAYNIIAQSAILEGTIRSFDEEVRAKTKENIELLAKSIASSFGATVEFEWKDFTSVLVNDIASTEEAKIVAKDLFGIKNVVEKEKSLGGDDFAEYVKKVKGVYGFFGTGNPNKKNTTLPHHDNKFDIDEDGLIVSVATYVAYAIRFLKGDIK